MTAISTPYESGILRAAIPADRVPRAVSIVKRGLDTFIAAAGFTLFGWLFPLIALAIYLDSPGPILYRQRRAGAAEPDDGPGPFRFSTFDMLKFRTMRLDAERHTGAVLASEKDPRVTRVGRWLRKTRLDELPQLWNVLRGEMSIVGPRPERPEILANLILAIPYFEERMRGVKPGITGLAQISLGYTGRALEGSEVKKYEEQLTNPFDLAEAHGAEADDMRMKLLYDLSYVATTEHFWSFLKLELYIVARTPFTMLRALGR